MKELLSISEAAAQFTPIRHYLNTASMGVPPISSVAAIRQAIDQWSQGALSAASFERFVASARESFARILGVSADCVAIGAAVSELVGVIANSLPVGSEVLCAEEEFASVIFPFLVRQEVGELAVKVVPLHRIVEAITPTTALVALSVVQSSDGRIFDRVGILEACRLHR